MDFSGLFKQYSTVSMRNRYLTRLLTNFRFQQLDRMHFHVSHIYQSREVSRAGKHIAIILPICRARDNFASIAFVHHLGVCVSLVTTEHCFDGTDGNNSNVQNQVSTVESFSPMIICVYGLKSSYLK